MRWENHSVTKYWLSHYLTEKSLCSLCGQSGVIDTRSTATSPTDEAVGRLNYCICPNGQVMRAQEAPLERN
jgi:hypothetical protein